jgi:hypothetical protein
MAFNDYYLSIPRNTFLRKNVSKNFSMYCSNPEPKGINLSSYWDLYLPKVLINLLPNGEMPEKISISHQGFAELIPIRMFPLVSTFLSVLRNMVLLFKFQCRLKIIIRTFIILFKTNRLLVFDVAKHAILISKVENLLKFSTFGRVVIIGDGFGFLGTLLKTLYPNLQITFVNLSKNLFLDYCFYTVYFKKLDNELRLVEASSFTNFQEDEILFFNVASLGEMTPLQISLYFDSIKKVGGTLVSLNRNEKIQPDGSLVSLNDLINERQPQVLFEENPCLFYKTYPTNSIWPPYRPFDGDVHFKIIKF